MKKNISILFLFLFWLLIPAVCQDNNYSAETTEKIRMVENSLSGWVHIGNGDRWSLAERMKKYNINGVSIAVINNYTIEWAKGYGYADVEKQKKVDLSTLFQAASISKSLNSAGVLLLVQKGKLDLKKDINTFLTGWKFPYDTLYHDRPVTLEAILSHTAGLSVSGFPGYCRDEKLPTLIQILDGQVPANTAPVRSVSAPGEKFIYSGGGTTISQLIVEEVSGMPYDKFMKKFVMLPLGMKESSFSQPPGHKTFRHLATGYHANGSEVNGKFHVYPEMAAAGLWTTPSDLCRYVIETQLSFTGKSSEVLEPEMTRLRLKPVIDDAALGFFVNSRVTGSYKYFNHNGGNEGFCCTAIGCMNEGKGVVIMTNTNYDNTAILEEIVNSVATVYNWKDYYLPERKTVMDIERSFLEKYAGTYTLNGKKVIFSLTGKTLRVSISGAEYCDVYFTSATEFFIREAKGFLNFLFDEDNKVIGFSGNGITANKTD